MPRTKKIHLLPNILTAFALTCGLFAIFKFSMISPGTVDANTLKVGITLLILAGVLDILDGAVARVVHAESEFGGIFDSLADAISFGVAPTVIILKSLSLDAGTGLSFLATTSALVYSMCGVLRLVRFNVLAKRAEGNIELEMANKKNFTGLPIPAAAAAAVSLNALLMSSEFQEWVPISLKFRTLLLSSALLLLGYVMVSPWKFPSLKRLQIRVASFRTVFLTVLFAAIIFYSMLHHFALVTVVLAWSYIALAGGLSLFRVIAGRKTQALEDFEPEHDDFDEE